MPGDATRFYLYATSASYTTNAYPYLSKNEATLQRNVQDLGTDNALADGTIVRYKIAKRRHWLFNYQSIRNRDTFDGGMGFTDLEALYLADTEMYFVVPQPGIAPITYTVRFEKDSWRDGLLRALGSYTEHRLSFGLVQTVP